MDHQYAIQYHVLHDSDPKGKSKRFEGSLKDCKLYAEKINIEMGAYQIVIYEIDKAPYPAVAKKTGESEWKEKLYYYVSSYEPWPSCWYHDWDQLRDDILQGKPAYDNHLFNYRLYDETGNYHVAHVEYQYKDDFFKSIDKTTGLQFEDMECSEPSNSDYVRVYGKGGKILEEY